MSWFNLSDNINLLAIIGTVALVLITFVVVSIYFKDIKSGKASGESSKESWDGIKEYKNPLPLGWIVSFILVTLWGIWYMCAPAGSPFAYPLNAYSQIGEYNEEVAKYNNNFQNTWSSLDKEKLNEMGKRVYLVQCAICHGIDGKGIDGKAADLTVWGSENGAVEYVISGSKGLMYDAGPMLAMAGGTLESKEEAKQAVAYMFNHISTSGKSAKNAVGNGEEIWNNSCAACHGEDGEGMGGFGPNLTKYGTSEFVLDVLKRGKGGFIGDMPNFNDGRLADIQKRAVAAYVSSLSN